MASARLDPVGRAIPSGSELSAHRSPFLIAEWAMRNVAHGATLRAKHALMGAG